jgi:hypothetical protein
VCVQLSEARVARNRPIRGKRRRTAMLHMGAFAIAAPRARLSPMRLWPHNAALTWLDLRTLFGAVVTPDTKLGIIGAAFGLACLLAAAFGLGRVVWTWRAASRAEQLLCAAIIFHIGLYLVSVMPTGQACSGRSRRLARDWITA